MKARHDPGFDPSSDWGLHEDDGVDAGLDDLLFGGSPKAPGPQTQGGPSDEGVGSRAFATPRSGLADRASRPVEAIRHFALSDDTGLDDDSILKPMEDQASARIDSRVDPWSGGSGPIASLSGLRAGDLLSGFLLVGELGRGAFARVFLAEQVDLGRRRVALKISRAEGEEPQMLARLQHAHIVPIHSLHDDPRTGLRLLCMPYLGGANLAQVLETALDRARDEPNRLSLVDALDEVSRRHQVSALAAQPSGGLAGSPSARPTPGATGDREEPDGDPPPEPSRLTGSIANGRGPISRTIWHRILRRVPDATPAARATDDRDFDQPARRFLRQADTLKAAVWVVARLAEGLEHAHSRGLLHRDLKPSNVLIAGDGTPMLLDFNLSADARPAGPGEGEKALLGGTLPYMSPEHLAAFDPGQDRPGADVDERSDLYSLGLILHEMVTGEHPFPEPPPGTPLLDVIAAMSLQRASVPSARAANPSVPWSIESVIRKCLDPDPARRYARARDLADDLKRYLEDLPLKHAPEPSIRERFAKWTRRNPRICSGSSIAATATAMMIGLGGIIGLLSNGVQDLSSRLKYQLIRTGLDESRFALHHASGLVEHLDRGLERASKTRALLGLDSSGGFPEDSWFFRLTGAEQEEVRALASELILAENRAKVHLAERRLDEKGRRSAIEVALRWLDVAERLDPDPPAALYEDRARYYAALGRSDLAARDRSRAEGRPPRTSRDFLLLGTSKLAHHEIDQAESALARAVVLAPKSFWAWFTLGLCHLESARFADAAGDFSACIAIEPRFAWPHLNRGLALARAGRLSDARDSYRLALKADPSFSEAWLNLALATLELGELPTAEMALDRAIELGRSEPAVLAALAEVKARRGDRDAADAVFDRLLARHPDDPRWLTARGIARIVHDPDAARRDLERAIELDENHARALYGLALLSRVSDPRGALVRVDAALREDPNLIDALQLRALLRARVGDLRAIDDVERLCLVPTPHRLYNAACAFALLARSADEPRLEGRALGVLGRALEAGFPAAHAASDPDLSPLRGSPEFRRLIRESAP